MTFYLLIFFVLVVLVLTHYAAYLFGQIKGMDAWAPKRADGDSPISNSSPSKEKQ